MPKHRSTRIIKWLRRVTYRKTKHSNKKPCCKCMKVKQRRTRKGTSKVQSIQI